MKTNAIICDLTFHLFLFNIMPHHTEHAHHYPHPPSASLPKNIKNTLPTCSTPSHSLHHKVKALETIAKGLHIQVPIYHMAPGARVPQEY